MHFLIVIFLFSTFLGGYDFSFCHKYYKEASSPVGNSRAIHLEHRGEKVFLGFFLTPPENVKIIKSDPFIGLYLFDLPHKNRPTYKLKPVDSKALTLNVAGIGFTNIQKGIILGAQKGFLNYARFSESFPQNGVVSNICYQIYGLGIDKNLFMDTRYIERFLDQKTPYYGDIGVRIYPQDEKNKELKVQYVDPFFPNNPFLKNDKIIAINQQIIKNYDDFEWLVSNLQENTPIEVKIERIQNKQIQHMQFEIKVQKRYGGFLLPDIFFDRLGIKLNNTLEIIDTDLTKYDLQRGLIKGDTILWINGQKIFDYQRKDPQKIQERIRYLLTEAVSLGKLDILISRGQFQFTINLLKQLDNDYIKNRYNPFGF